MAATDDVTCKPRILILTSYYPARLLETMVTVQKQTKKSYSQSENTVDIVYPITMLDTEDICGSYQGHEKSL